MSKTYHVAGNANGRGRSRVLHSNRECGKLELANVVRATTRDEHPELKLCPWCEGTANVYRGGNSGPHERLKQLGEKHA